MQEGNNMQLRSSHFDSREHVYIHKNPSCFVWFVQPVFYTLSVVHYSLESIRHTFLLNKLDIITIITHES